MASVGGIVYQRLMDEHECIAARSLALSVLTAHEAWEAMEDPSKTATALSAIALLKEASAIVCDELRYAAVECLWKVSIGNAGKGSWRGPDQGWSQGNRAAPFTCTDDCTVDFLHSILSLLELERARTSPRSGSDDFSDRQQMLDEHKRLARQNSYDSDHYYDHHCEYDGDKCYGNDLVDIAPMKSPLSTGSVACRLAALFHANAGDHAAEYYSLILSQALRNEILPRVTALLDGWSAQHGEVAQHLIKAIYALETGLLKLPDAILMASALKPNDYKLLLQLTLQFEPSRDRDERASNVSSALARASEIVTILESDVLGDNPNIIDHLYGLVSTVEMHTRSIDAWAAVSDRSVALAARVINLLRRDNMHTKDALTKLLFHLDQKAIIKLLKDMA